MKHQLDANIVMPARAEMESHIAQARGDAAPILEKGRAQAEALRGLAQEWKQSGPAARDMFLLQKLETILPTFLNSIRRVRVDNITMLQGMTGDGGGLPGQAVATVKALEAGGVDVSGLLSRLAGTAEGGKGPKAVGLSAPQSKSGSEPKAKAAAPPPQPKATGSYGGKARLVRRKG
jgi:flotillin